MMAMFKTSVIILLVAVTACFGSDVHAATIAATACSNTAVQNAINSAASGDTVTVPAGDCTWSSPVTISGKAITLRGAGVDQTTITRNTAVRDSALGIGVPSSGAVTLTGFTFQTIPSAQWGIVSIGGGLRPAFRVTHCKFIVAPTSYTVGSRALAIFDAYGVVDHCTFINTSQNCQSITLDGTGSAALTANWSTLQTYGDPNTVVIEDCAFTNTYQGDGAIDAYDGNKFVFRHNTVTGTLVAWHGADSSPRAPRLFEIYQNTFTANANGPWMFIRSRGGTGVLWGNTMTGASTGFCLLSHYRADPSYGDPPGSAQDGGFNVTDPGPGYPTGYPLLDQVGRGSFPSGNPGNWPNRYPYTTAEYEALEPMYQWNNTYNGNTSPTCEVGNPTQSATYIVQGRDYYDNVRKPGYTPLAYPHPFAVPPSLPQNLRVGH